MRRIKSLITAAKISTLRPIYPSTPNREYMVDRTAGGHTGPPLRHRYSKTTVHCYTWITINALERQTQGSARRSLPQRTSSAEQNPKHPAGPDSATESTPLISLGSTLDSSSTRRPKVKLVCPSHKFTVDEAPKQNENEAHNSRILT
jgi:hypothetical protein